MLSPEFCNATDVRRAIGLMNKSGLLEENIKAVGVKKDALVKSFLDAVDSIPEDSPKAAKIPADALAIYNAIVEGEDPSPEEAERLKAAKKKTKEKVPRGPNNEERSTELYTACVAEGADVKEFEKRMTEHFTVYYTARGKAKDDPFIAKRVGIYSGIAKKRYEKEHPDATPLKGDEPKAKEEPKEAAKPAAKTEEASADKKPAGRKAKKTPPPAEEPAAEESVSEEA